jgi:hypothetical protein
MQTNHDFEIIDVALLANVNGGDAAADWRKKVNDGLSDSGKRWDRAIDAAQHGEYRESVRQAGAWAINFLDTIREFVSPLPKVIFGDNKDSSKKPGKP